MVSICDWLLDCSCDISQMKALWWTYLVINRSSDYLLLNMLLHLAAPLYNMADWGYGKDTCLFVSINVLRRFIQEKVAKKLLMFTHVPCISVLCNRFLFRLQLIFMHLATAWQLYPIARWCFVSFFNQPSMKYAKVTDNLFWLIHHNIVSKTFQFSSEINENLPFLHIIKSQDGTSPVKPHIVH